MYKSLRIVPLPFRAILIHAALRHCRGFALLAQLAAAALASAAPVQVETLYYRGKTPNGHDVAAKQIAMPRVRMENAAIAAKINDRLFIGLLGSMAPRRPDKYFSAADGVDIAGLEHQKFSVARNDGRILSLDFDYEACGASCEGNVRSFAFDVSSGRYLSGDALLTSEGRLELGRRMVTELKNRYRREIAKLNRELRTLEKRGEKREGLMSEARERLEFNEYCFEKIESDPPSKGGTGVYSRFDLMRYRLAIKALEVTAEHCSSHASRGLDDVGDVTVRFAYAELRPYLTPYARALLLNEQAAPPSGSVYGPLLRGRLGPDIAITMVLEKHEDSSVGGVYFYDRVRKPIQLGGREKNSVLELTEQEGGGEPKAKLVLTVKPGRLEGTWEGARSYPVELAP